MSRASLKVEFEGSYPSLEEMPAPERPEYAFIGRSNVGKSSLINLITGRKELAYTSGTPGKTRMIHSFSVENGEWALIDLPGYGYAKVSKKERNYWDRLVEDYIRQRSCLVCLFVLVDANVPPQKKDLDRIRWLGENELPFAILFTKTDKGKQRTVDGNIASFKKALEADWAFLPQSFKTSAKKGAGKEELLDFIDSVNEELRENGDN